MFIHNKPSRRIPKPTRGRIQRWRKRFILPAAATLVALATGTAAVHAQSNPFAGYIDLAMGLNLTRIGNMSIDSAGRATGWGPGAPGQQAARGNAVAASTLAPTAAAIGMPARLASAYPAQQRAEAERVFRELLAGYGKIEQRFGIPKYDVAGAIAAFLAGGYMGYHNVDFPDEHFKPLVAQMRHAISANPAFAKASQSEKRDIYEQMAILGMFMATTQMALKERAAPQAAANLKRAAKAYLEQFLQTDAARVQIGAQGLVLK